MIDADLAARLRTAGLPWRPASGDRFTIPSGDFQGEVFVVAEMTIDVQDVPGGSSVFKFNGTTEWALDSVDAGRVLWLPREDQLRELLRGAFRSLVRLADTYRVEIVFAGEVASFEHPQPEDAYALALLHVLRRIA